MHATVRTVVITRNMAEMELEKKGLVEQPTATVQAVPVQAMDRFGAGVIVQQQVNVMEVVTGAPFNQHSATVPHHLSTIPPRCHMFPPCQSTTHLAAALTLSGCEAKNKYNVFPTADKAQVKPEGLQQSLFVYEESECCQRICCGPNRALDLKVVVGDQSAKGDPSQLLMTMHKDCHCQGCCCMRPSFTVNNNQNELLGTIEDPFACCKMNQKVFRNDQTHVYTVEGSICQLGLCCPCCGDVVFDVADARNSKAEHGEV